MARPVEWGHVRPGNEVDRLISRNLRLFIFYDKLHYLLTCKLLLLLFRHFHGRYYWQQH